MKLNAPDVLEDDLVSVSPALMRALLKDHTRSTPEKQVNIFWATDNYEHLGRGYGYFDSIEPEQITGRNGNVIMPRVLKNQATQNARVQEMAEVFTPPWICNAQNNMIDREWFGHDDVFNHENSDHTWEVNPDAIVFPRGKTWKDYVKEVRMEITCGEAPYLVSRYDSTTGQFIPVKRRIGLLDRKLRVISENAETSGEWLRWARVAYQSVYGYEWQGDNLLLARENMLVSMPDYYDERFGKTVPLKSLMSAAYIISWNLWQMDGLKGVIPNSCHSEKPASLLTGDFAAETPCPGCQKSDMFRHNGIYCLIRDWKKKRNKQKLRYIDLFNS